MPSRPSVFAFDWDADVSDETRDRLFDKIVEVVHRWRLEMPVMMLLETGAPMSHLAGQGLVLGAPFLAPWLPGGVADVQTLSKILEKPANVRRLLDRLADAQDAPNTGRGKDANAPRE